jgi:ankyrin repeat protein
MKNGKWCWVNKLCFFLSISVGNAFAQNDMEIERTWPPITCYMDLGRGVSLTASPKIKNNRLTTVTMAFAHRQNMGLRVLPTRIAFYSLPDGKSIQPTSQRKLHPELESSGRVSDAIEFTFSSTGPIKNVAFAFDESAIVQIEEGSRRSVETRFGSLRLMDVAGVLNSAVTVRPSCPTGLLGWKPKELLERRLVSQNLQTGLEAAEDVLREADIAPPENLILAALHLWRSGRGEEAAFWLAAGIYRASYSGNKGLGYGYYMAMTIPVLEHARSVPKLWANSLQKAIQWDDKTFAQWEDEQERSDKNRADWMKKRTYQREDTLAYAKLLLADPKAPALDAVFPISASNPLRQALVEKDAEIALNIVRSKAIDLNRQYPYDSSYLHLAASQGYLELIATMIDQGAKTEATDYLGNTPLGWARDSATIQTLLNKGANVNAPQGLDRQTLLLRLISSGTQQGLMEKEKDTLGGRIAQLLKYGADVNIGDAYGRTPLHIAAASGDIALMSLLIDHGANVNAVTSIGKDRELGNTSLAMVKNVEAAALLINNGASLQPMGGDAPLLYAVKSGNVELVKLLLDRGSDPNGTGGELKFNTLYYAIASKDLAHLTIAELLIKNGANVNASVHEETMLQWAKKYRNGAMEKLLREAGAT